MASKRIVRIILLKVAPILLGLVLIGWLVACSSQAPEVPPAATPGLTSPVLQPSPTPDPPEAMHTVTFDSLGQGDSVTAGLVDPTLFVAGSPEEADRFTDLLDDSAAARRIQQLDFDTVWVVAVFSGVKGSSGYGITVQEVSAGPTTVGLTVNLTGPAPDQAASPVESNPYHVIVLPREGLPEAPRTTLIVHTSEGTLLVHRTYP